MFWLSLPVLKPDVCAADTDMVHLAGFLVSIAELTTSILVCRREEANIWKSLQLSRFKGILYRRGENSIRNWAKLSSLSCQSRSQNTCRKVAPAFWRPPLPWRCPVGTFTHRPRRLRRTPAHLHIISIALISHQNMWSFPHCCAKPAWGNFRSGSGGLRPRHSCYKRNRLMERDVPGVVLPLSRLLTHHGCISVLP